MKPPPPAILAAKPAIAAKRGYLPICPLSRLAVGGPLWNPAKNWAALRIQLRTRGGETTFRELDARVKTKVDDESAMRDLDALNTGSEPPDRIRDVLLAASSEGELVAFSNLCPHAGFPLHAGGNLVDIEDAVFGKVPAVSCQRHGWTFDALSGACLSSRNVLDVYGVEVHNYETRAADELGDAGKGPEPWVFISKEPVNDDVEGKRSDFGGKAVW